MGSGRRPIPRNYHSAEDIRKYKDAYKAIYYLLSIEKDNK